MSFTISLEELLERQPLHEHWAEEWKNKMTYDEYYVFEQEAFKLARERSKKEDGSSFSSELIAIYVDREIIYDLLKVARKL